MRFYFTLGDNSFAPFKVFGLQRPPEPKIENKFVQLKKCLVDAAPLSVEEFLADFSFNLTMMIFAVIMFVALCISGRTLMNSALLLLRFKFRVFRVGSKFSVELNASYWESICQNKKGIKESGKMVQDVITAYEGISTQVGRMQEIVAKVAKKRPVLEKSPVVITSYPGAEELGGNLAPEHEYWLALWTRKKHPFVKIPKVNWNEVADLINKLPSEKTESKSPTEEDWLRYYEKEMAEQAKQKSELLEMQDIPEHRCTSSSVVGALRKMTKMRKKINKKTSVHFMEAIEEVLEPMNLVPFVSGATRDAAIITVAASCNGFDLNPEVVDFVDEFLDDLPLIRSEDITDLCRRTPLLSSLTPNESTAVEIWLRSYQAPYSFREKYPNLWY